ncbi:HNH endonuclease signature motif containing protein [Legionella pneumophila serogroup 1]
MELIDVNDFVRETECFFEEERYSVRDNGAVFRHARIGKRVHPNDNYWTFGKTNSSNPYLHLSDVRIHRIVATAFHGEPPNPQYVVDHMDTNCRNNRPENLRWVTRLENALMNPVTRKKIEFSCGSIEAFLANPSMLNKYDVERNFEWMRTVTREEAQNCKERMAIWAESNKNPRGGVWTEQIYTPIKKREADSHESKFETILEPTQNRASFTSDNKVFSKPSLDEWVHAKMLIRESELVMGLTKKCAQYKWRVPSYFPCCPEKIEANPIEQYFQNLNVGAIFSYNDSYPASTIMEFIKADDNSSILVMCKREGTKPYSVAKITFENDLFIHSNLGSFFGIDGAKKTICLELGLEWTGGDTFDDYC